MKPDRNILPAGKLPATLLERLLKELPSDDPDVLVGPGIGRDAAVVNFGGRKLIFKTDPITLAGDNIAWYLLTVNSNDIACMGGIPKYFLVTTLLPEGKTTETMVEELFYDLKSACLSLGVSLIGGHSEITHGIDRPIVIGFMIGEAPESGIINPSSAKPGNLILLSKHIPLEAISIIARDKPDLLNLEDDELKEAKDLIYEPGISVLSEARSAYETGGVTAMHDPTEGGLATGLSELAKSSGYGIEIDYNKIPFHPLSNKILGKLDLDPLGSIASGSLLVCCEEVSAPEIIKAWKEKGIKGSIIGKITEGPDVVLIKDGLKQIFPEFDRDEIAKLFGAQE